MVNLTNTHALYLESLSIEKANLCQRYELGNGNSGQRPYTPAPLQADCEEIHEVGSVLLATLGYPIFEPLLDNTPEDERIKFYCKRTGADASACTVTLAVEFDADPNLLKEIYLDFVYRDTTPDLRGILKTLLVKPKIKEQIIIVSTIRNKLFEIRDVHEDAAIDSEDWN